MSVKCFFRRSLLFLLFLWILAETTAKNYHNPIKGVNVSDQVRTDAYNYHVPTLEDESYFKNHDQFKSIGDQKDTYYEVKIPCYGSDKDMSISTPFLKITCASWMDYEKIPTDYKKRVYGFYEVVEEHKKKQNPFMDVNINHNLNFDDEGYAVSIVDYKIIFKNYSYPNVYGIDLNRKTRINFFSPLIDEIAKMHTKQYIDQEIEKTIKYNITTLCDSNMAVSERCWKAIHGKSKKSWFLTTKNILKHVLENDHISILITNGTETYFTEERREMNNSLTKSKHFVMHTTTPIAGISKDADDSSFDFICVCLLFGFVFVILLAKSVQHRCNKSTPNPNINQLNVV